MYIELIIDSVYLLYFEHGYYIIIFILFVYVE